VSTTTSLESGMLLNPSSTSLLNWGCFMVIFYHYQVYENFRIVLINLMIIFTPFDKKGISFENKIPFRAFMTSYSSASASTSLN
jgi:hypothetical protein